MKVLFAVNNEKISQNIVSTYQRKYKEIISSKNVYYFNAIQNELRKDNTYDRIVVSEDLEPFTHNDYEEIDNFIFGQLDVISDEATNSKRNDTPIILICSDRRSKSEDILVKLFSIGIYNAVLGNDRSIEQLCDLIKKPRSKKEAKQYYRIDTDDVKYSPENENEVSEVEIQNILNHYKKLGKNEEKYAESFESIAAQYNEQQLRLIASILPLNVRIVLETKSPTYQKIMTGSVSSYVNKKEENGISMNFIPDKSNKINGNVIVPSAINKKNAKKIETTTYQPQEPQQYTQAAFEQRKREEEAIDKTASNDSEEEIKPKRRGRPRKNPELKEETTKAPKRRGRPKKNTETTATQLENKDDTENIDKILNEVKPINNKTQETINLFDLPESDDIEEKFDTQNEKTTIENDVSDNVLPGLADIDISNTSVEENKIKDSIPEPQPVINPINFEQNNEIKEDNNSKDIDNSYKYNNDNVSIQNLITGNKKIVTFVGTSKNGTSFIVNNVAEAISQSGINTAILDTTKNRNSYYIYTQNEEELRGVAQGSIKGLQSGLAQGIKVNKNLNVYTAIPDEEVGIENYKSILETLLKNHDLILIDCDFDTNEGYFAESQEIYLIQSLDVLTIQPLTAFLRNLKTKNILKQENIRIVINKDMKVRELTSKNIIGGMSFYNEPSMSFMTELFNRDTAKYCTIPFEQQTYARYLEGLVNCKISLNGYSKNFMQSLTYLTNMVYPLIGGKSKNNKKKQTINNYQPVQPSSNVKSPQPFSKDMNNTLNQMKNNF